ncbi:MAG TPA: chloride channel protein [Chthonomonadales bacterium]|nr:chloride channel protein [Chthonomonadales bacterium]
MTPNDRQVDAVAAGQAPVELSGVETSGVETYAPVPEDAPPELMDELHWYNEHAALLISTVKWALLGAAAGMCVGVGTRVFLSALAWSSAAASRLDRGAFHYYYLLPLALPACVWLVRTFAPTAKGHGTEAVITAVHTRSGKIDLAVAPIKLLATVLTLAFGGSVGKEGPCAQIGASISSAFADLLRLSDSDRRRLVICGIGAGFAAVFGTPISGALFGIEVLYLGRIEYPVLFPCLIAGIVAHLVCGAAAPVPGHLAGFFALSQLKLIPLSVIFGAFFGIVALLLIETMRNLERLLSRFHDHPYAVAASGGILLALLFRLAGSQYAGLGTGAIELTLSGSAHVALYGFLLKIVATSVTLETGGSGGIVTPLFFIGAAAGSALARIFHLPESGFAAFGFVALVGAAANTPIAAAVMGIELLPGQIGVYAALCACTAFLMVGHRSVYASQKLGLAKSAGLDVTLDVAIGDITPSSVRLKEGSLAHRLLVRRNRTSRSGSGSSNRQQH